MERFFRAFQRFYATRGGFHSVLSAKRERLLLVVVYVFTQHATTGHAPIEVIVPEARRMPLYRVINAPFNALQERGHVKDTPKVAELLLGKAAAASMQRGATMQRSRTKQVGPLEIGTPEQCFSKVGIVEVSPAEIGAIQCALT
jgi:hypothetical protein